MSSSLEEKIIKLLKSNSIPFEREKQCKDCRSGFLRYDFWLEKDKTIIEVHGPQHYEYIKFFYKNKSDFTKAQERDRQKIGFALSQGFKIYCIPYWEIDNITSINLLFQDKFLAKSKFKNDDDWRDFVKNRETIR